MATVNELTLKIAHVNGDSTSLKFSSLSEAAMAPVKSKIKAINSGTISINGTSKTVNYQPYLLSKAGSPAVNIDSASLSTITTTRVYTQGQE